MAHSPERPTTRTPHDSRRATSVGCGGPTQDRGGLGRGAHAPVDRLCRAGVPNLLMQASLRSVVAGIALVFSSLFGATANAQKAPPDTTLHVQIAFADDGAVTVQVVPSAGVDVNLELARLAAHWYSKLIFIIPSPEARGFLLNESRMALFQPKTLAPRQNVLARVDIADVVKLVPRHRTGVKVEAINLYLVRGAEDQRGLVSYLSEGGTEQQGVFSWGLIVNHAAQTMNAKQLDTLVKIMANVVKAYSAGADMESPSTSMTLPNTAYFKLRGK